MKRLFDILFSLAALILFSPVLLAIAVLVRINLGSPVLFSQRRPGRGGVIFTMWKFRSMVDARDAAGNIRSDAERLTRFGHWLRASSLDELPELWNILCGDMSLVGPRPLLVEYLPLYSKEQARRHEVRPGLTGWAQINGRNARSGEEKFCLDVWYVEHRTFWLDIKVIMLTAVRVLRRKDVSAAGEATMPRFTGDLASDPGK